MTPSARLDRPGHAEARAATPGTLLTAHGIARFYSEYISALWHGEDVSAITTWLDAHWIHKGPPVPDDAPDAVSLLGGGTIGGVRIRWYQIGDILLGYQSGRHSGCYRIPVTEPPPSIGARPN